MNDKAKTKKELMIEVQELRSRLEEAEDALRAIRSGEVDALVVTTPQGEEVFTLKGAEQPYRVFVEAMNEGAATLDSDGTILYCNSHFAKMFNTLHAKAIGSSIYQLIPPTASSEFESAFQRGKRERTTADISLKRQDHGFLPVQLSLHPLHELEAPVICMLATDLTERKRYEEEILKANALLEIMVQERNAELTKANETLQNEIHGRKKAEEALRQEHDRLEAMVRSIPDEVWFADSKGQFTLVNPSGSSEFDLKADATIDVRQFAARLEVRRPDGTLRPIEEAPPLRALRGEFVTNQEEWIRSPSTGELRYRQVSAAPVCDGTGNILGSVSVARDITALKRSEEEQERLRVDAENEKRRLEAVMEALPVGVALTDTRGGSVRSNKTYEDLWGSPRPKVDSVDDYEAYKAWWSDTGKPVVPEEWASALAVQKGHAVIGQLMEIERFDGSRASVINSGAPVFDADGNITGCAVAIQDISDLRKAEKALRESEERLRRIIETAPVAIGFGDSTGRIFEANQAFYRLTGYTREEIHASQLGWDRLTAPEYAEIDRQIMTTLAAKESARPYEKEYIRKDGSRVPLLLSVSKFPGRDEHIAFIVDITERKRTEESLKKNKERFELLADTASKLLATQNPQGIVNELCQKVMTHLDCHAFFNYLVDPIGQGLHLNAWAGIPEQTAKEIEWIDYGVAVCGCAARDAARIVCENIPVTPDPRTELVKSFGIKAYACHPLLSGGQVIGTLSFGTRTRTAFAEDELSMMKGVAHQVATAMDRNRLIREIEQSRDELEKRVLERTKELKRAGETLKAERQRFFDVLETLPAYVVLLTPDYYATFANRTFTERFGESHGRRCFEFLFGRSEPCEPCETYSVLKTMAPHGWEWTGPDGRIYSVFDFPFVDTDGSNLILEMGIDITEQKRAQEELKKKEEQIRFFASQYIAAQETERRRVAVELHDAIASSLAGIKFRIEKTLEDMKQGLFSVESMKDVSSTLAQTIGEVRRIMADLRPSILDDLGIMPALNWLCREFETTYSHFSVEKQIGISEDEIPDFLKIVMFRISQEALTNIARHSGASLVDLALQKAGGRLELTIQDNGSGFRPDEIVKGLGLSTMRERAELTGGTFSVESAQGKGTTIRASWPLGL